MSERRVLCLKSALRLERQQEQGQEEAQSSATIMADVKRFAHQINTDEVFGTHSLHPDALFGESRDENDRQLASLHS
jgi:hypothetical protein